jgi:hypothetical protein
MAKKASKSKVAKAWVYSPTANVSQKLAITKDFDPIIQELKKHLKPLPVPQQFNQCVDVFSKWRGNQFYIMQKFKTGENAIVDFFETGIARLEYYGEGKFNLAFFRYTGQWVALYEDISTEAAKKAILEDEWFQVF